jgi:hypothetical protein
VVVAGSRRAIMGVRARLVREWEGFVMLAGAMEA